MRVTTAFNRMLRLPGVSVKGVSFTEQGAVVRVRLRRRRRICSRCGQLVHATHDTKRRRWRHLDLGPLRCFIEAELRRVKCPDCGVRVEAVAFARPGARHTREFEDLVAFMAQAAPKSVVARALRVNWETVGRIVERVVADHLDERRFDSLRLIGVDEVSYRRRFRYLTCVADHEAGAIVWAGEGAGVETLERFFAELGPERCARIEAASIDMSPPFIKALSEGLPGAEICFDPFHVVQHANAAVDAVRREEWRRQRKSKTMKGRWVKSTRWALLKAPERQSSGQRQLLAQVQRANARLYRAFLLKEQLRELYRLEQPELAPELLEDWLVWARRSRLAPFIKLAEMLTRRREGVLAAIRLGLSNGRLEGLNSKIRLISHRAFGFHSAGPLIAMVYLCCGGIEVELPMR